jgi:ABC-type Fe3+ transport system substrate-binding protein
MAKAADAEAAKAFLDFLRSDAARAEMKRNYLYP